MSPYVESGDRGARISERLANRTNFAETLVLAVGSRSVLLQRPNIPISFPVDFDDVTFVRRVIGLRMNTQN
jgi:hypothetical protein